MPEIELKPCPFCGETVELWDTNSAVVKVIECKRCKIRFVFSWDKNSNELFQAWNRRENDEND